MVSMEVDGKEQEWQVNGKFLQCELQRIWCVDKVLSGTKGFCFSFGKDIKIEYISHKINLQYPSKYIKILIL